MGAVPTDHKRLSRSQRNVHRLDPYGIDPIAESHEGSAHTTAVDRAIGMVETTGREPGPACAGKSLRAELSAPRQREKERRRLTAGDWSALDAIWRMLRGT